MSDIITRVRQAVTGVQQAIADFVAPDMTLEPIDAAMKAACEKFGGRVDRGEFYDYEARGFPGAESAYRFADWLLGNLPASGAWDINGPYRLVLDPDGDEFGGYCIDFSPREAHKAHSKSGGLCWFGIGDSDWALCAPL